MLFAMLALLQLSSEVLASSEPTVLLSLSYQSVIPPSTPPNAAHQQLCWELASYKVGYLFFFFSQTISHYLQGKVTLLLVSGSYEKKEEQHSDVCTWTKDNETRTQAEDNNAPVSFSKPFT